jgi:hypothetical protein
MKPKSTYRWGKVLVIGAFCGLGMAALGDEIDHLTVSY